MALKKLARPFQTAVHAKRTYREIRLLKHMHHENVSYIWLSVNSPTTSTASGKPGENKRRISSSRKLMEFCHHIKNLKNTENLGKKLMFTDFSFFYGFIALYQGRPIVFVNLPSEDQNQVNGGRLKKVYLEKKDITLTVQGVLTTHPYSCFHTDHSIPVLAGVGVGAPCCLMLPLTLRGEIWGIPYLLGWGKGGNEGPYLPGWRVDGVGSLLTWLGGRG